MAKLLFYLEAGRRRNVEIHNLSELQYNALKHSAENAAPIIASEPNPIGTQEEREASQKILKDLHELTELGLMLNVTSIDPYRPMNEQFLEQKGYGMQFFIVSKQGGQMFLRENLVVN